MKIIGVQQALALLWQTIGTGLLARRSDQACDVERAHRPSRRMPKPLQERRQPALQLTPPTRVRHHDRLRSHQIRAPCQQSSSNTLPK